MSDEQNNSGERLQPSAAAAPVPSAAKEPYEKTARDQKKELESLSPFNVTVGKVYDGPMDLLLDLIRKQDIDVYDIPIAKITAQFLAYVEKLKQTDIDSAGDFIYTAALLIQIKSRMLLPRSPAEVSEGEADDPRRELVERLLEHERFKNAAQMLHEKQQIEAATWTNPGLRQLRRDSANASKEGAAAMESGSAFMDVDQEIAADTMDLVRVFREILERLKSRPVLDVEEDAVTVSQMIDYMRRRLVMEDKPIALGKLLANTRSERALITMFLALLELVRLQAILLRQDRNFSDIFVKKHEQFEEVLNERMSQMRDDWS